MRGLRDFAEPIECLFEHYVIDILGQIPDEDMEMF